MMANSGLRSPIWRDGLDKIVYVPENETEALFGTIYISPCEKKISNDPFEDADLLEDLAPCDRTIYECPRELPQISEVTGEVEEFREPTEFIIKFDYEMHYDEDADLSKTMSGLEGSYLNHLAASTGLLDCEVTSAEIRNRGNNRRLKSTLSPDQLAALLAIRTDPEDEPDPANSKSRKYVSFMFHYSP